MDGRTKPPGKQDEKQETSVHRVHLESVDELPGDGSGLDSTVEIVDGANRSDEAGLPREAERFAQAVNAFDASAVRAENARGVVFLEFAGSPGKLLIGCGEEMESADGGVDRGGVEKAP